MDQRSRIETLIPLARQARYLGRYRQIVQVLSGHGFGYVLEQLGLFRLLALPRPGRREQANELSGAAHLRLAMVELGPAFIKLGQVLSTRPDLLPAEFITEFSKLQSTVPPFPNDQARQQIEAALGQPVDALFEHFDAEPVAAASIGQVYRAYLPGGIKVAVKVQRPQIDQQIATDLAIINDLAGIAQRNNLFGPQYDLVELAWEFSTAMRDELDYTREASNTDQVKFNFRESKLIRIPTVFWAYSSSKVLTLEWLDGIPINDVAALAAAGIDRRRLARNSLEIVIEQIYIHGFFHGDPHPGNIFALADGRVGAIDFGQMGAIDRSTRREIVLLMLAMINNNPDGALQALIGLGVIDRHDVTDALRRDVVRFMQRYVGRPLKDLTVASISNDLIDLLHRHRLRLPSQIALLLKSLITMEGTARVLDPEMDIFAVARPMLQRVAGELIAPQELAGEAFRYLQDLNDVLVDLPKQLDGLLYQVRQGDLLIRTREEELRRVANALLTASSRLAVALIVVALIISMGLLGIAYAVGDWQGMTPIVLAAVGGGAILLGGLLLLVLLVRGN